MNKSVFTLVKESVGKDIPRKKPIKIPAKVIIKSLIISLGFLMFLLHPKRGRSTNFTKTSKRTNRI